LKKAYCNDSATGPIVRQVTTPGITPPFVSEIRVHQFSVAARIPNGSQQVPSPVYCCGPFILKRRPTVMVKKVEKETATSKIRLPKVGDLSVLMKQTLNYDARISSPTTERAELMEDYKTNKHVDPPAFNIVKAMFKLSDEKLAKRLAHLQHYIEHAVDPRGKTLADRAGSATKEMFEDPPRGKDEDGESDPRPRHLRQPGASGADIDEAERAAGSKPADKLN
jgi:hypothetical protein